MAISKVTSGGIADIAAGQAEIDAWVAAGINIGKTWNPSSNALED